MCAAEEAAANLYPMPDHSALAMLANGGHQLNRALEAVKYVPRTCSFDYEGLVIFIAADFAICHGIPPLCVSRSRKEYLSG